MTEPKRRWFQIHLSTAVVMMVVAGVVLGFNLNGVGSGVWGWPFPFIGRSDLLIEPVFLFLDFFVATVVIAHVGFAVEANTRGKSPLFVLPCVFSGLAVSVGVLWLTLAFLSGMK